MTRWMAALLTAVGVIAGGQAFAQEPGSSEGPVVVTIIPAGGTFFTEGKTTNGPSFGNYNAGAAVAFNFNRYVGVEGEVAGAFGITQDLEINGRTSNLKTPNVLNYTGNIVLSAA